MCMTEAVTSEINKCRDKIIYAMSHNINNLLDYRYRTEHFVRQLHHPSIPLHAHSHLMFCNHCKKKTNLTNIFFYGAFQHLLDPRTFLQKVCVKKMQNSLQITISIVANDISRNTWCVIKVSISIQMIWRQ